MKNLLTLVFACLCIAFKTQSQTPPASSTSETHNFITYDTTFNVGYAGLYYVLRVTRPANMFTAGNPDTASRPAIIMMGGAGEVGSNAALTAVNGPHYWLAHGWDGGVVLGNGKHYPVIISVQANQDWPQTNELLMVLTHILKTYHIKRNSVHLTGLSMGAFAWTALICHQSTPGGENGMKLVTSIAALEGQSNSVSASVIPNELTGYTSFGHWAKKYNGKFFGLEGVADWRNVALVSKSMNDSIPGSAYFSYENIGGGLHCCWNSMYDPSATNWTSVGVLGPNNAKSTDPNTMGTYKAPSGIFQWMIRQGDTAIVGTQSAPLPSQPPVANAGPAQTITLPTAQVNLSGSATEANGIIASYAWTKYSGGAAIISSPSSATTAVTGLVQGSYVFRLTATDNKGSQAFSDVTVTVNAAVTPPPVIPPVTPPVTPTPLPPVTGSAGLHVVKPITCEYRAGYIASDGKLYSFTSGSSTAIPFLIGAGRTIVDGAAGFNVMRVLDDQGYVWSSRVDYTTNMDRIDTDTTGAAFSGSISIYAYANTTLTIKGDGSVWYMGSDTFHLYHTSGQVNMRPARLSPAGMVFKKLVAGGSRIVGLTTSGQVYEWLSGGSTTPVQKTIPRAAVDIFASHLDFAGCIIPDATGSQTMGYPFVWGNSYGSWGGNTNYTQPTSVKALWNMSVPIKEISANWNTTHYIDSLGRMFGIGSNVQGEIGNGVEYVNKYTYNTFPGYGWDFNDGEFLTGSTPIQIGTGVKWKKLYSNNFFAFYKYAQDENDSVYSWGRNKSLVLGNGYRNLEEQYSPNSMDVLVPTMVHPLSTKYQTYNFTAPSINAGTTRTITAATDTLTGFATGPQLIKSTAVAANGVDKVGFDIVSYQWTKVSGNGGTITSPNSATTTVTGLTTGTYVFNLKTTDSNTGTQSANDTVIVSAVPATVVTTSGQPIPGIIQAESYSGTYGTQTQPTTDISGGLNVGWITYGSWMDYNVTAAAAGTYTVSFRVATVSPNTTFVLRSSTGSTLASIKLISPTGGYQAWQTVSTTVNLPAGNQTLRIFSTCSPYWNINWMEFAITAKPLSSVTTSTSSQQLSTLAAKDLSNTLPSFTVYPNPVRDNFLLDINNSYTGVMNVQVVDQSGKTKSTWVLNKPLQSSQVSLSASDLSKGIYFIRVQIGAWSETRKMLKL